MSKWYQHSFRRNLIDMHITDWNDQFLSRFDPDFYVDTVCSAQADAAMVYANSHVGLCYYPTQIGHQHKALKGRDIFGPVVEGFHKRGIPVITYFTLIYDDYQYRHQPDWRMRHPNGEGVAEASRYGLCCPNSPHRAYSAAHVRELCQQYQFEGIFLDMTFWPNVCYCEYCRKRFKAEMGSELPTTVNWENPVWVTFQRKREAWLNEFAMEITNVVREAAPGVTVQHQGSTYPLGWRTAVTERLAKASDYVGGDFYGDSLEGSVVRKLFHNLSPNLPQEFMTTFAINLNNHTAKKSPELLEAKASACLADSSAFLFIDAIDPIGTINPDIYKTMRCVFERTKPYERFVGGQQVQDVGIYLNTEAKYDPSDSGKQIDDPTLSWEAPHLQAIFRAARTLAEEHIPYGVFTRNSLGELNKFKAIVLPNMLTLSAEEADALREWVRGGGILYASGDASALRNDGQRQSDFMLADVFGASYEGKTAETFTYIAPTKAGEAYFPSYSVQWPLGLDKAQVIVRAHDGAEVLGTLTLPYTLPSDPRHYASIHSNPPGIPSEHPALILNHFGKGMCLYCTGTIEAADMHRDTFAEWMRLLAGPFSVSTCAPKAVEVTSYRQPDRGRMIISLVNFQKDLPNIPVNDIEVRADTCGKTVRALQLLPDEKAWAYRLEDDAVVFSVPTLETLRMFALYLD
ncbi:MAG: hypothetical protein GXY52_08935 [Chloroflexi bacterium]|nr:hypothetical protein [Chloroflexota bacterium]